MKVGKGKVKTKRGRWVRCSRGHRFYKFSGRPVCPICYPGYYKKSLKKS